MPPGTTTNPGEGENMITKVTKSYNLKCQLFKKLQDMQIIKSVVNTLENNNQHKLSPRMSRHWTY